MIHKYLDALFRPWIHRAIAQFEQKYAYDGQYMHVLADSSTTLARRFAQFIQLSAYRQQASAELFALVRIAALRYEDCGPCLQLTLDHALEAGVDPALLKQAVLSPEQLTGDFKLAYDYAQAICTQDLLQTESLQTELQARWGQDIVIELALAVATVRVYPVLKRGLGFAKSCQRMRFDFGTSAVLGQQTPFSTEVVHSER